MFLLAEQARGVYGLDDRGVQRGDWVLDCGANVGVFVREALLRGAAKVFASNRRLTTFGRSRLTFAREVAEGRVVVYPKGVWDKDDTLTMWSYANSALDSLVLNERSEATTQPNADMVPLVTIDHLVQDFRRSDWISSRWISRVPSERH